jgi:hypothetical protein
MSTGIDAAILQWDRCGNCGDVHTEEERCRICQCGKWKPDEALLGGLHQRVAEEARQFGKQDPQMETSQAVAMLAGLYRWETERSQLGFGQNPKLGLVTSMETRQGRFSTKVGTLPLKETAWTEYAVTVRMAQLVLVAQREPEKFESWIDEVRRGAMNALPQEPIVGWFLCLEHPVAGVKGQLIRSVIGLDVDHRVHVVSRGRRAPVGRTAEMYTPTQWDEQRGGVCVASIGMDLLKLNQVVHHLGQILALTGEGV